MTQAMALDDSDFWIEDAVATIHSLSYAQEFLTADDLRREMRPPAHQNWPGLAFGKAKRQGLIESVNTATSKARSRNCGSLKVWTRKTEGEK